MIPLTSTDRSFLKYFAILIGALHVIALGFIGLAFWIYSQHPGPVSPARASDVRERIAPVGAVYAGETGRAAALAASQQAAQAAAASQPFGGSTDGKVVFDGLCQACHAAGVAGAPKVGDAGAWQPRIAQGEDTLLNHAIHGFTGKTGTMPPKGGNPALSDAQVKAAVDWMVAQVK